MIKRCIKYTFWSNIHEMKTLQRQNLHPKLRKWQIIKRTWIFTKCLSSMLVDTAISSTIKKWCILPFNKDTSLLWVSLVSLSTLKLKMPWPFSFVCTRKCQTIVKSRRSLDVTYITITSIGKHRPLSELFVNY